MKKYMLILAVFGFMASVQAADFVSIGTCTDIKHGDKMRILIGAEKETQGLLVVEGPSPEGSSEDLLTAETIQIKKISEEEYSITLEPTSFIGAVSGSFKFSLTKNGADWPSVHRTYNCKLD